MNIQYNDTILHPLAALIMVVMRVYSVFMLSEYRKRKLMYSTIQIMFDQALFANTNALFKDCRLIDPYNTTIQVNHMVDLDKLWSYSGLKRLKTDQVSPVSIFLWPCC